ncbi:hypothetical protein JX265_009068 [Neoarthrinium moseri]|uniref:ASST-domain-containing protein n=1 Tax=Neoarthrinium moseri TaxID=1658444 RepID=A0A9P9WH95_9PEZI|nr:uncharacterized protein JN550_011453 [Neoarthrinium moseri]KAI1846629.1 hypothetical protein JX266_007202 [Neoarthrinium moseri]KAI1860605.1 hypothetical protein JN550_011453 [Neoarthrinium moseri]KAI1863022.1 hypothetical protein JX265_009068 [Neoarthrinium moseri]
MSDEGELVWEWNYGDLSAFKAQKLDGKDVVTFFNGVTWPEPWGWGYGAIEIFDDSYESIYNVTVNGTGLQTLDTQNATEMESWLDMHEALITPEGTMLVTGYNVTQTDLTSVGGPADGWLADCMFYEIDIKTNTVLYKWNALAHEDQIPLTDALPTYPLSDYGQNQTYPWGPFHINTVEKFDDGSYIISSRHYCSIFKISADGSVEWTLHGQTGGDFELGEDVNFCYQHDIRVRSLNGSVLDISLFNNANAAVINATNQTTGLYIRLDTQNRTATIQQEFIDPLDAIYAKSQGNLQTLPNGNVIMGYGSTPRIKEYYPNGTVAMSVEFGPGNGRVYSYRAYRLPWVGRPSAPPKAFACRDSSTNETIIYMSWNGATEHSSWDFYAGYSETDLQLAGRVGKSGFETSATINAEVSYVRVEAQGLNAALGTSEVVAVQNQC